MPKALSRIVWAFLFCSSLTSCMLVDWPYYEPYVLGGKVINRGGPLYRKSVEVLILSDVKINAMTLCGPRKSDGYQGCHILIERFYPAKFAKQEFVVRDRDNPEVRYDAKTWETSGFSPGGKITLTINLNYEMPPKQFILQLPPLIIDGKPHKIPEILFTYKENTELVPIFANF